MFQLDRGSGRLLILCCLFFSLIVLSSMIDQEQARSRILEEDMRNEPIRIEEPISLGVGYRGDSNLSSVSVALVITVLI